MPRSLSLSQRQRDGFEARREALVQAGAAAALVAAAHEAVRAGHAGALKQACRALFTLASVDGAEAVGAGADRRGRGPGRGCPLWRRD
jgi:hypothetical protein